MNNLTTRKIVLGVLMTLVLAFSVQGIADALTFRTSRSGDLVTVSQNQPFNITFYPQPTRVRAVDDDGDPISQADDGNYYSYDSGGTQSDYYLISSLASRSKGSEEATVPVGLEAVYDYDEEAIAITSDIALTRSGTTIPLVSSPSRLTADPTDATASLWEGHTTTNRRLSGSITLTGSHATAGEFDITITDVSPADDFPTAPSTTDSITFTVFVVNERDITATADPGWGFTGLTAGYYKNGGNDYGDEPITQTETADFVRVQYKVLKGSGRFYVEKDSRKGTSASTLSTSSAAVVKLDMNGTTNKVEASIAGVPPQTALFIFGYPNVAITGGNNQEGVFGGRLEDALVVKVTDGKDRPIPELPVDFDTATGTTSTGDTAAMFIPVPGTTVYVSSTGTLESDFAVTSVTQIATLTRPASAISTVVQTDSRGEAKTYFQLSNVNTETSQDVDVTAGGSSPITPSSFTFTAGSGTRRPILSIFSGDNQRTDDNGDIDDSLIVVVRQDGHLKPGEEVTFRTIKGTLSGRNQANDDNLSAKRVYGTTDGNGRAQVIYYQDPGSGSDTVTATISGDNYEKEVTFNINGTGSTGGGAPQPPAQRAPTTTLTVTPTSITGAPDSVQTLRISAGAGNSGVQVLIGQSDAFLNASGSSVVQPALTNLNGVTTASITLPSQTGPYGDLIVTATGYTPVSVPVTVGTATPPTTPTTLATLTADKTSINGAPGSQQRIIATARNAAGDLAEDVPVTFSIVGYASITQNTDVFGTALWNFTLPTTPGPYTLNITATNYRSATASIAVGGVAPVAGLRLVVSDGDNQTGEPGTRLTDPLVVTVVDSGNQRVAGQLVQFSVTRGGGRVSPSSAATNANGQAQTRLTLGRTAGTNTVRATLNGVSVNFTATAEAAPAFLDIYGGNNQRGTVNNELANPLVVQVVDDDENGVANVRVDFRVTSGSARLSQRGTGLAARVFTDRNGMAETPLTPTGTGTITVRAAAIGLNPVEFTITTGPPPASLTKVSGDNQAGNPGSDLANPLVVEVEDAEGDAVDGIAVTFEVTAGGGSLSTETATTNAQGRAQTSLTLGSQREINSVRASVAGLDPITFNTSVEPVIHIAAAKRPVMYWIDGGALYRLAGEKPKKIAESANDVAVDTAGGKIYWTEQTGNGSGKIHSANLDGSGAQVIKELDSLPYGLAVDSANGKLYLTNGTSKIRQMNVDGTEFKPNFIRGLDDPLNIAVSSGRIYWTEGGGNVRFANLEGKKIRDIATGTGALGGIAVGGNKVYWTEQAGQATGSLQSANLDGTGVAEVIPVRVVPRGIAVDVADGKIFWADDKGRIRRVRINNLKLLNIVTGLITPSALALGVENAADAAPTQTETPRTPTTAKSKYDVNGDGTVDNVDAALVASAMGTSTAAYDVNEDGTVNFLDLLLVFDNREDAAAAPTVARTRLTAVQVDRIQEQIELLLATNDRSPAALYTLTYLQNLIAVARPEKTQLLANYPNPFNPETWIPYELATDTNVKLTIYNAHGAVVRTLSLGHQTAGYYTGRDRAAYWDGRNSFGELVASGLYFYQLETDKTSSMRKMVILK